MDTNLVSHYSRAMKNITVTLPAAVARWVRVRAAQNDLSVSRWLARIIEDQREREDEYEVAMRRFLERARQPRTFDWADGSKPTREELHGRAVSSGTPGGTTRGGNSAP